MMKAGAAEVRQFAEMLIADHTATTEQLKRIASTTTPAIALPMQPDARHQNMLNELMMLEGANFDRRYVAQQTEAHREAIMLMEAFADRGDQQDLKQFAAATAPKSLRWTQIQVMRVLLTGSTGLIGSAVLARLVRHGHDVTASLTVAGGGHLLDLGLCAGSF